MNKTLIAMAFLVAAASLTACGEYTLKEPTTFEQQSRRNEENVKDLISRNELPKLTRSLDFENVKQRLEYLNQANNIGYLYLLTANGQLIKEVQVLGKITSLNTYITPMEEIKVYECVDVGDSYGNVYLPVQAPDLDGTYGENADGIFWFTPDGIYGEWNGPYLFSAERLSFNSKPVLIEAAE